MTDATPRSGVANRTFLIAVVFFIILKLWLTSEIRTVPAFAPHDASNFIEHGKFIASGHWFGPYDDRALIKQPFFPMYLAMVQESGLPLNVAHVLLDALAAIIACFAIRPLVRSQGARAAIFVVLFFNPFSYDTIAWLAYRSQVNPALALLSVSCALGLAVRRTWTLRALFGWAAGLGFAFAAFWLTREEAIWLAPAIVVLLAAYCWPIVRARAPDLSPRLAVVAMPVAILILSVALVMIANGRIYGWAVTNEQQAPEFVSAFNSIARIDVPRDRFFPVPKAARLLAYKVSPAARELQPALEGNLGAAWNKNACAALPQVCGKDDIGGGWFVWAFRDAVSLAGHYTTGADARAFYLRLAAEVDAACDARTIPCRHKGNTLFPPVRGTDVPEMASNFFNGMRLLLSVTNIGFDHWLLLTPDWLRADYTFVTRSVDDDLGTKRFDGWLVHKPIKTIEVTGPGSMEAQIDFKPSPDVDAAVAVGPRAALEGALARFEIRTFCADACLLKIVDSSNTETTIPLNDATHDYASASVVYHIDSVTSKSAGFDDGIKTTLLREIARLYQNLFALAFWIALALVVWRLISSIRNRVAPGDHVTLAIAVYASVAALVAMLAIISVLAFPAFSAEYMGVMMPLLLLSTALSFALDGRPAFDWLAPRLLKRQGASKPS